MALKISSVINNLPSTKMAESAFSQLVSAYKEYKTIHEIESTKREYIRAQRDVSLARINAQKEILETYLVNTFQERRSVIEGLFRELDKGIDSGNDKLIAYAMQGIVSTVQTSPLQGVSDFMRQLDNPEVKELEI